MPPEAVVLIVAIVFASVFGIAAMILSTIKARYKTKDASLRTSDLEALMRRAVEEANAPLMERIDAIEHRLEAQERPLLLPAEPELLDEIEVEDPVRVKTRTRS